MSRIRTTQAHDRRASIPQRYGLLVGTVAPRPIALASTVDAEGRRNLAPFSYFNVFSIDPRSWWSDRHCAVGTAP